MKTTWRYTVVFVVGILVGLAGGAWGLRYFWHHGPFNPGHILSHMDRQLHLTADQKARIAALLQEESVKMKFLRDEASKQFEVLRQEGAQKIRALLDPQQQVKFDEMKKRFEKHHPPGLPPDGPGQPPPDETHPP